MTDATKDTYSQFVRYAKLGFPLLAVILFFGVFFFSKSNPIRDGVIIPNKELVELAVGQKVTNPHYSGVTKSGDAFSISAESALPNGPELSQVDLVEPSTTIGFADGLELNASSDVGHLNLETQEATLTGTVYFETSDKYKAKTDKVIMNFYTGNAHSPGPVEATGPIGHITAGKMALTQNIHKKASEDGAILSFGNGVKLVYYPAEIRE